MSFTGKRAILIGLPVRRRRAASPHDVERRSDSVISSYFTPPATRPGSVYHAGFHLCLPAVACYWPSSKLEHSDTSGHLRSAVAADIADAAIVSFGWLAY